MKAAYADQIICLGERGDGIGPGRKAKSNNLAGSRGERGNGGGGGGTGKGGRLK